MSGAAARFVPLGYFPKRVSLPDPDWRLASNVAEVCSVSTCMSDGPAGWMEHWRHNDYFFFDSEEIAGEVAAADTAGGFEIFAYGVLATRFGKDGVTPVTFSAPNVSPRPSGYRPIGFDVVECWQKLEQGMPFECSPLSCNGLSSEIAVNRFCLIEDFESAYTVAQRFGLETDGVEPGPYYLFEVWRRFE